MSEFAVYDEQGHLLTSGDAGDTGSQGDTGIGDTGSQGDTGIGDTGSQGDTGTVGSGAAGFWVFSDHVVNATRGTTGDYSTWILDAADEAVRFSFGVPNGFSSLTSVKLWYIGGASSADTLDWTVYTDFGAEGEAKDNHSDSVTADGLNVDNGLLLDDIDITAAFTGLAAGDKVGVYLYIDAISGDPAMYLIGLEFNYIGVAGNQGDTGIGDTGSQGDTGIGDTGATGVKPAGQLFLTAAGGWPSTTNGCADPAKNEWGTNDLDLWYLAFDKDSDEFAQWTVAMPSDWDAGTVTATFYWTTQAGGSAETVKWYGQGTSLADNDAIDAGWGTAVGVEDTWLADDDLHISAATGNITIANATASELVQFRVYRDISEDDLGGDAWLLGVMITFTRT